MSSRARARKAASFALFFGAACVAACTLTTSFDGLQGGLGPGAATADARASDDAPSSTDGASPRDARADALGDTGAPIVDASIDAACPSDTTGDPRNCGACHDCVGGACIGSVCQPSVLASSQGVPRGLSVFNGNVYWASNTQGTVMRVGTDGTGLTPLLSGQNAPLDIAVRADGIVLLTGDGAVTTASLDGAGARAIVAATGSGVTGRIATSGASVYFTRSPERVLSRVAQDGGAATALATAQTNPFGLAASATRVFWSADIDGGGAVQAIDPDGTNATVLVSGQVTPRTLALFGSTLYWVNSTASGNVMRAVLQADGGVQTSAVATAQSTPWAVVDDGTSIYWTTAVSAGGVYTCPRTGCGGAPRTLLSGLATPTYLATDSRAVYVATNSGTILKIAK